MQWLNKTAYEKFRNFTNELPKNAKIGQKCDVAATRFIEQHGLISIMDHRALSLRFKRMVESRPGNKTSADIVQRWESSEFYSVNSPPSDEKKSRGRPNVTLADAPCLKKMRTILKEAVLAIETFAMEQNVAKEEALRMVTDECHRTWHTDVTPRECTITVHDAVALVYNVNISMNQYQMLRTLCLPHHVVFPTRNSIDAAKSRFHPAITSYQLKSSVDIKELVDQTAASIVNLSNASADSGGSLQLVGKFGVDGSGSHKIRQQLIDTSLASEETSHLDPKKTNSFLLSCYCPLELRCNDTLLWSNPVPNSTSFARPVTLTRVAEDRDVLRVELESSFSLIRDIYQTEVQIAGKSVVVNCRTECSMVDGKMVGLLQGDSGAFCHLCHVSREDANDINVIAEGFKITKNYESCKAAWEKMTLSEIALPSKDRQGQCHENILKTDLFCFSVLHFKLRSLDFAQKILYHLVGGQRTWSDTVNLRVQSFILRAKKECIDAIREKTGMLMDSPCGSGGNTNTGPIADRFFSRQNRSEICSLILNSENRENFETFLYLTNIVLTVSQSVDAKKRVRIDAFKSICIELMLHVKTAFLDETGQSWIMIIPTFHQLCGHSWQLFELNNGTSIAKWSESPVESWNKHVRSFQSGPASRSRQLSIKDNIHDIFRRMSIMSHPEIAMKRPRPRCSVCGEVGHTARSSRHSGMASVMVEEEARIESLYF